MESFGEAIIREIEEELKCKLVALAINPYTLGHRTTT
jgi:hypothetical protein